MDNSFSQPSLVPATLPSSFESDAGTTKTDFANAILEHLKKSQIVGLTQSEPNPLDITQLASDLTAIEIRVDTLETKTTILRKQFTGVVNNTTIALTFADLGTTDYQIVVNIIPAVLNDPVVWTMVENFKSSTEARIRITGLTSTARVEVSIMKTGVTYT